MTDDIAKNLAKNLSNLAIINDPFLGMVAPTEFKLKSPLWPGDRWARIETFAVTTAEGRKIEECRFFKNADSEEFLPVAFMFESLADGRSSGCVYSDHHLVEDRGEIHEVVADLQPWQNEDDVLFPYFKALKANQLDMVMSFFEAGAYFQHSNGETFRGHDEIRQDFVKMLGDDGIKLRYCRVTDDGTTCVLELYMPTGRPAIAIYQRSGSKLHAVRIYL